MMRKAVLLLLPFLLGGAGRAQAPDYFPLQVGNQWIYRPVEGGGEPLVVEIASAGYFDGQGYVLLRGLAEGDAWLRLSEERTLYRYNRETRREEVWLAFGAATGEPFATAIHPCNPTAVIASRAARWEGPIGEFDTALEVAYPPGPCADAGLQRDYYLPYVGLIERTVTTIAGPRRYQLVYARLGGVTFVTAPELSVSLALDRHLYTPGAQPAELLARLTVRNSRLEPLTLNFGSSQRFDLAVKDEQGREVYRWSEGKAFLLVFGSEQLGTGERNYVISVPLVSRSGAALPPGHYAVEAWVTNIAPPRLEARAGFEIRSRP
jgi:hypothetical protein